MTPTPSLRRLAGGLALAAVLAGSVLHGASPLSVRKLQERRLPISPGTASRVDRPYFDDKGQLAWDGSAVSRPVDEACPAGATLERRLTHLLGPRVDEVRCLAGPGVTQAALLGVDAAGKIVWRRPLGFRSGELTFDETVLGATRDGIVLNNLTVLDPGAGTLRLPAPAHPVGREARPVPDYNLTWSTIFLPDRRAFVTFEADVTLLKRSGGVYLLDPKTGRRDLLIPVATTLLGGHWRVETMALDPSRRYLLLAQKLAIRSPGGVSFSVFDLASRRTVFTERFSEDHYCSELGLAVNGRGDVGFTYADATEGLRVLVHYRLTGGR